MPDRKEINKRGYLKEDFRLFHLKDSRAQKVDYHYHAFDKLILLLGGKVTYVVEGVTYFLQPWDLLLVGHDLIHRPIIHAEEPYERAVLWLGRDWIAQRSDPGEPLDAPAWEALLDDALAQLAAARGDDAAELAAALAATSARLLAR